MNTQSTKARRKKKSPCSLPKLQPVAQFRAAVSNGRWIPNWLTISGSGEAPVFTSADDQPWAAVRDQITEVWFEDVETLSIPDLAYWFEGCVNLTTAELPLAPTIGKHAFYNCPKLNTITMYYGETVLNSIGEDAFWRETDSGDTLYIAYIIGYPEATVPFYSYDWMASNRSNRYFYDLYGVYSNADGAAPTETESGAKKAPAKVASRASTGIVGTCPSCKKKRTLCREHTFLSRTLPEDISNIMNVIFAIIFRIWGLMCIKTMVPARMVLGLARTAEAIHGFWTMKVMPLAHGTGTGSIAAIAARASAKPSMQPVTAILMEAGSSIPAVSTVAKPIAGTAAIRITNMPATA